MAILNCSDDNQNPDSKTFLEIKLGEKFKSREEEWQRFSINFISGKKTINFNTDKKQAEEIKGLFCLNVSSVNELKQLTQNLSEFIKNEKQKEFVFETIEPSFELRISKAHNNAFKVYSWVDSGNTSTIIYTWDALGIRYMTSKENLLKFIDQLTPYT